MTTYIFVWYLSFEGQQQRLLFASKVSIMAIHTTVIPKNARPWHGLFNWFPSISYQSSPSTTCLLVPILAILFVVPDIHTHAQPETHTHTHTHSSNFGLLFHQTRRGSHPRPRKKKKPKGTLTQEFVQCQTWRNHRHTHTQTYTQLQ